MTRPIRQLKGFQRVRLEPGQSARVRFTLTRRDLMFIGRELTWTVEPGRFTVWIGPNAEAGLEGIFELLADAR